MTVMRLRPGQSPYSQHLSPATPQSVQCSPRASLPHPKSPSQTPPPDLIHSTARPRSGSSHRATTASPPTPPPAPFPSPWEASAAAQSRTCPRAAPPTERARIQRRCREMPRSRRAPCAGMPFRFRWLRGPPCWRLGLRCRVVGMTRMSPGGSVNLWYIMCTSVFFFSYRWDDSEVLSQLTWRRKTGDRAVFGHPVESEVVCLGLELVGKHV